MNRSLPLRNVHLGLAAVDKVIGKVVDHAPVEVFVHVTETVALLRQHEHIEAFVGADQGVDHTQRIARMHVVVDIAVHEQQVPLELACDLGVGTYVVDERRVALLAYLLLDAVVRLAPPAVVDAVVVVARA